MTATELTLQFATGALVELVEAEFLVRSRNLCCRSVRGKTAGACTGFGTFQWTSAVKSMCRVMLLAKIKAHGGNSDGRILGGKGSAAASLDYAITKGPAWLGEMFGWTSSGTVFAKRLFLINNTNQKRPGPVVVKLNEQVLEPAHIRILCDGREVSSLDGLSSLLGAIGERELMAA